MYWRHLGGGSHTHTAAVSMRLLLCILLLSEDRAAMQYLQHRRQHTQPTLLHHHLCGNTKVSVCVWWRQSSGENHLLEAAREGWHKRDQGKRNARREVYKRALAP